MTSEDNKSLEADMSPGDEIYSEAMGSQSALQLQSIKTLNPRRQNTLPSRYQY